MDDDTPAELPCVWTLLGATMALMTAHATPPDDDSTGSSNRRRLIARKIASNLFFLQHHPLAPPVLGPVLQNLQRHWARLPATPATGAPLVPPPAHATRPASPGGAKTGKTKPQLH